MKRKRGKRARESWRKGREEKRQIVHGKGSKTKMKRARREEKVRACSLSLRRFQKEWRR